MLGQSPCVRKQHIIRKYKHKKCMIIVLYVEVIQAILFWWTERTHGTNKVVLKLTKI